MNGKKNVENEIKVSVIIPVYNVEAYLEECINSILKQKLSDIEILLVDDGSTDLSGDICDRYAQEHSNIYVIHKINEGQGKARNIGISKVSGKYVYFMDSDDWLDGDALLFLYNEAEKTELDVILFSAECFSDDPGMVFDSMEYQKTRFLNQKMSGRELFEKLFYTHEYSCSIPMRFYRRKFLEENDFRFPEGIIHEDEIYGFFSLVKAERAECIGQQFYKRRYRKGSTMTGKKAYNSAVGYEYTWKELLTFSDKAEGGEKVLYLQFTHEFFKLIMNLYYSSFSPDEKKQFKTDQRQMLNAMSSDYKKVYKEATFFLINPFFFRQYRRISEIFRLVRK